MKKTILAFIGMLTVAFSVLFSLPSYADWVPSPGAVAADYAYMFHESEGLVTPDGQKRYDISKYIDSNGERFDLRFQYAFYHRQRPNNDGFVPLELACSDRCPGNVPDKIPKQVI